MSIENRSVTHAGSAGHEANTTHIVSTLSRVGSACYSVQYNTIKASVLRTVVNYQVESRALIRCLY